MSQLGPTLVSRLTGLMKVIFWLQYHTLCTMALGPELLSAPKLSDLTGNSLTFTTSAVTSPGGAQSRVD